MVPMSQQSDEHFWGSLADIWPRRYALKSHMRTLFRRPVLVLALVNALGLVCLLVSHRAALHWPTKRPVARYQVASLNHDAPLDDDNKPRSILDLSFDVRPEVYLVAQPRTIVVGPTGRTGCRLLVVNGTATEKRFYASDYGLMMVAMAKVSDADWLAIEELPWSTCGNSYHRVSLPARSYWEIPARVYLGSVPSTLRYGLMFDDDTTLYSNEFYGLVDHRLLAIPDATKNSGSTKPSEKRKIKPWTSIWHE